jgi:uncharacterized protein (DUF2147 family)
MRFVGVLVGVLGLAAVAHAQMSSPIGDWRTIDDHTGKPRSIVRVWEREGVLYGTIETIFPQPGQPAEPVCDKCSGSFKNKPVKGMNILWDMKREGNKWGGGHVLDPDNGHIYKGTVEVVDGGRRLRLHGYVGLSFIGRTQYWERVQ